MRITKHADVARVLKNARLSAELTQQQVADSLGVTRQTVARIERGTGNATLETYFRLFSLFELNVEISSSNVTVSEPSEYAGILSGWQTVFAESLARPLDAIREDTIRQLKSLSLAGMKIHADTKQLPASDGEDA